MNGGHSTGYFDVKRGVRQGDPLSPYLFVIAIETLALFIRNDTNIKGIRLGDKEIKQVLYADDITIFVRDINSVNRLKIVLDNFEAVSGLKVNKEKTHFIWLGKESERYGILEFGNLVQEIKILGVYFVRDVKKKDILNYKEILSKTKRLLGWWKQRDLTIMGRIQLLKMYALSKFNYVSSLISVPQWVLEEVEKISFDFIWRGKDRIKRKILYQDYEFGGLRMTCYATFVKTQRVMWLKRLLDGKEQSAWKLSFDYFAREYGGRFIFLCDYDYRKMKLNGMPQFYKDILKVWQELDTCRHYEVNKRNPIIFNNRHICLRNKMVFDSDLVQKGISRVFDMIDGNELKPTPYFWDLGIQSKGLLRIYDIFMAMPKEWKEGEFLEIHSNNFDIKIKILGHIEKLSEIKSRKIYDTFIKQFQQDYRLQIREGQGQNDYTYEEIKDIFLRVKSSILCGKQREFQFKLLHGAIYTKENLYRFGFTLDNLCSYCHDEAETYSHLFFDCLKVQRFWLELIDCLQLKEIRNGNLKIVLLGLPGKSSRVKVCNSVIFLLKYIIYSFRIQGELPSIQRVIQIILGYKEDEKRLAIKRGKLNLHLQKWEQLNIIMI